MVGIRTPEDSNMTIEQIDRFILQTKKHCEKTGKLEYVQIMGGEPLIHPQFSFIYSKLDVELVRSGTVGQIIVQSNGIIGMPNGINRTEIKKPPKQHIDFYVSPKDKGYSYSTCRSPEDCGIAVNAFGYFPCAAGYSLIYLFNFQDQIKYDFPDTLDVWDYNKICPHCCHSVTNAPTSSSTINPYTVPKSETFIDALKNPPTTLKRL
jgi:hypothetical protein